MRWLSIARHIADEIVEWTDALIRYLPGTIGRRVREFWIRRRIKCLGKHSSWGMGILITGGKNISIGDNFLLMNRSRLYGHDGRLEIGDRVAVNENVTIAASDDGLIRIGSDVLIGPNVVIRASNHVFKSKDKPINQQGHTGGKITIEDDVWIGSNVVILPDVTIGAHSVVAAGAVVTHAVEPWTVVGGVPARVISKR